MKTRAVIAVAVVAVAVAGGVAAVVLATRDTSNQSSTVAARTIETSTAKVVQGELTDEETLDGEVTYRDATVLNAAGSGVLTGLSAEGTVVDRGGVLYEVDGISVPLLFGAKPMWRTLTVGTEGEDVRQLEENLVALGYAKEAGVTVTVDDEFTSATAEAVVELQADLDRNETGSLAVGDVVFLPGAVRMGAAKADLGARLQQGNAVAEIASAERIVTIDLEPKKQSLVSVDAPVTIRFRDGRSTPGRIASVAQTVTTSGEGDSATESIEVTAAFDDPAQAGTLDKAPVDVKITKVQAAGVLSVPIKALLSLAEGGYAVEVVGPDGAHELVAVTPGAFGNGRVAITGDIAAGDDVVVPK